MSPTISFTRASYCCASTASVVTAPPMIMFTAVSVPPRQRTAATTRVSMSTTASMARAMVVLPRFCAMPDTNAMATINPKNANQSLRETRMLSSCIFFCL